MTRAKILILDDEAFIRELVRLHLGNHGYEVIGAADALVAIQLVLKERPDLVIVDVFLPHVSGYDFVASLRKDPKTRDIPVVFLTIDENVPERAKSLGVAGYLVKPITVSDLVRLVEANVRA